MLDPLLISHSFYSKIFKLSSGWRKVYPRIWTRDVLTENASALPTQWFVMNLGDKFTQLNLTIRESGMILKPTQQNKSKFNFGTGKLRITLNLFHRIGSDIRPDVILWLN